MKARTIIFFVFVFLTTITSGQIKFENTDILFDSIYSGQKISKTITFKNISANAIKVKTVQTSCGCLYSKWTKTEILPNKQDSIVLIFDSNGKIGLQNKIATISFDNDSTQTITFKGFVKPSLINYTVKTESVKFIKSKKDYKFEITNTGDSIIYITDFGASNNGMDIDTISIKLSVSKEKLKKNETAIIKAEILKEVSQDTGEPLDYFEIGVHIKDCCGLTETGTTLTIKKE